MNYNKLDFLRILNLVVCVMVVSWGMAQNCHIKGRVNVPALQGKSITLKNMNTGETVGSSKIMDSTFSFDVNVSEPYAAMLVTAPQNPGQRNNYYLHFIVESGNIYCDLLTDSLSGTHLNERYYQFFCKCKYEVNVINSYYTLLRQMVSMPADERMRQTQEVQERMDSFISFVKETYEENKTNAVGALVFENYLEYDDTVSYETVMQMLLGAAPVVTTYQPVLQKLAKMEKVSHTAAGKPYIDLDLTDYTSGRPIKLSKVIDGKVALIDFWASWCRPCRAEIPNIKNIHEKYGSKNFVVVSLNVWDKPEGQAKAIKDLDMTWTQLTDATRNATDTYGIDGIPQILLIGKDGKIIARNLRGEEIEHAVKKALGK